jgi:carbon monoxide dehydrogenase subunit G
MKMSGSQVNKAPRKTVWYGLNDSKNIAAMHSGLRDHQGH